MLIIELWTWRAWSHDDNDENVESYDNDGNEEDAKN